MIDIDKYKIEDDVTWLWKDHSPDEEGWILWEYKECPAEKGGYALWLDGKGFDKTYEPWFQVLPALKFQCEIDERMQAIVDLPLIIQEVKRLREAKEQLLARVNRSNRQLVRATEWAYKQYCYKKEKMEDFDNYVWDEEE